MRAAVLTVLVGAAIAVPTAPAAAAACTQDTGVTVVVDFATLGGGTQTRCASGDPTSGLAALRAARFTPTRAAQEPGYFVCRIDGKPADDPCQRTPPADAYWSYWHAKPGGTWSYSSLGPADHDPKPNTVEGWAFGAGKPPSSPPPRPVEAAAPTQAPSPPARSPSAAATAVASSPRARTTPAATTAAAPAVDVIAAASPDTSPSPSPDVTTASADPADPADPPPGTVVSRPNKYAGPVTAAVLVVLIAVAAVRRWRRRRESDG
jgi:hypothetical protein